MFMLSCKLTVDNAAHIDFHNNASVFELVSSTTKFTLRYRHQSLFSFRVLNYFAYKLIRFRMIQHRAPVMIKASCKQVAKPY